MINPNKKKKTVNKDKKTLDKKIINKNKKRNRSKKKKNNSKQKNKQEKENKTTLKQKQEKQIKGIVIFMSLLILILVLVPFIQKNFINKFRVINLEFQKTKAGDLMFYSTRLPVIDSYGQITGDYSINFRNDPRKLKKIEIDEEIKENGIIFIKEKPVYISIDFNMTPCEDNVLAMFILASFLRDFKMDIKSGISNEDYAISNNLTFIDCENSLVNTVIKISNGNETNIIKKTKNCYEITYKDCEIMLGVERFMFAMIEEYMSHFTKI